MLTQLTIRNFTIVDHLDLQFHAGMTVLTGETGAGKSILLDALLLAMGGRAESGTVRAGATRAEISAEFDIRSNSDIQQWLRDNELDEDDDCLIRRTIGSDGRSKGFINGRTVPMQSLRDLGDLLVDIHGQHAHQSLLKRHLQRQALDDYAGHHELLHQVSDAYQQWKTLCQQQAALTQSKEEREARIELLSYQTGELNELSLGEHELGELEEEHARLANLNVIQESGARTLYALSENEEASIMQQLQHASGQLEQLLQYDHRLENISRMLTEASIQVDEAADELRHYLDGLSLDPERLNWLDERLGLIHDLSRKHRVEPHSLPDLQRQLSEELATLLSASEQSDNLEQQIAEAEQAYLTVAKKLTKQRQKAAKTLSALVSDNMQQLGMTQGQFKIELEAQEEFSPGGMERVEFQVATNPGQPFKPMSKVASGGELSRISLAIQVITAGSARIPTLIFDEVDVGIGGGIAETVGHLLRSLSRERQVLCVTHQPQVASLAHQHLHVSKHTTDKTTHTTVTMLDASQRTDEIARMLGGIEITAQTLSHAKEMIERGQTESVVN
jgi:DNA repair protein RecN (Recombination protein N)